MHRLSDTVAHQLEQRILEGALKAGDRLPAERELAQQLDVSRPSLREALLILESRGLLQARRGGGFNVTDVTAPTITTVSPGFTCPLSTPHSKPVGRMSLSIA